MDAIEKALKLRTQELEKEHTKTLEDHRVKLSNLKIKEEQDRADQLAREKAKRDEQERKMRAQAEAREAIRKEERRLKAEEESAYNLLQQAIFEKKAQVEAQEKRRIELEAIEDRIEKDRLDAEALLLAKVDTETIMPNPLQRFFQPKE